MARDELVCAVDHPGVWDDWPLENKKLQESVCGPGIYSAHRWPDSQLFSTRHIWQKGPRPAPDDYAKDASKVSLLILVPGDASEGGAQASFTN